MTPLNDENLFISSGASIRSAVQKLNANARQILIVTDSAEKMIGVVTDGDVRRGILNGIDLNNAVDSIMNKSPKFITQRDVRGAKTYMQKNSILSVPVLDEIGKVVDLINWKDLEHPEPTISYDRRENPVFVMAGGKGTRLKPFTNILPKPLIPLGDIPIVEIIMNRFKHFGYNNFILSLNYKADMIRMYFADNEQDFEISYVQEKEFSGTAGSLALVKNRIDKTFFVTNCDIIMDIDFDDFHKYHKNKQHDLTVVGVIQEIKIPYGIMEMQNGNLVGITEKPIYDFIVNAGIYILEPSILKLIPDEKFLDMPDLMLLARNAGFKVGIYPIANEMIDVGHWDEYNLAVEKAAKLGLI